MNTDALDELVELWRDEARLLRRRGADREARTLESVADDLEERLREWKLEKLTLEQAAAEIGVTPETVGRRISRGKLPNAGRKHRPRVRRRDLFAGPDRPSLRLQTGEPDIATEILQADM